MTKKTDAPVKPPRITVSCAKCGYHNFRHWTHCGRCGS